MFGSKDVKLPHFNEATSPYDKTYARIDDYDTTGKVGFFTVKPE